jgi:hypothetical protein
MAIELHLLSRAASPCSLGLWEEGEKFKRGRTRWLFGETLQSPGVSNLKVVCSSQAWSPLT